jgi:hypothetical protein
VAASVAPVGGIRFAGRNVLGVLPLRDSDGDPTAAGLGAAGAVVIAIVVVTGVTAGATATGYIAPIVAVFMAILTVITTNRRRRSRRVGGPGRKFTPATWDRRPVPGYDRGQGAPGAPLAEG